MGEALNKARELDATYVMHTYGRSKLFVSGKGLMVGATLDAAHDAHDVVDALMERHIVANACNNNVLRLLPPLTITTSDVDTLITALKSLA